MSSSEEILSFTIVIDTKLSEETKKNLEELKAAAEKPGGAAADIAGEEAAEIEGGFTQQELDQIQSTVGDTLGGLDKADIAQFGLMAKNPAGFIGGTVGKLFTSQAAAVMGPLSLAIATPVVMVAVIKALSVKGGPFNRDWRRFISEEVEVGLSRVQQKEKELGITQTILTQIEGFRPNNENWTYNSLFQIDDTRIARIGLSDREAGVTFLLN